MKIELKLPSCDGQHILYGSLWYDDTRPVKGLVQIVHGMCEYIDRYEEFALWLVGQGYAVCGEDHLGHGRTAGTEADLGYFAPEDGWNCLVQDVGAFGELAAARFPGVPNFLLGHSMGSFISRIYITRCGRRLQGVILSGTGGPNPSAGMGHKLAWLLSKVKGERHRSPLLDKMAFGSYNDRFTPQRSSYDWLSRDPQVVDRYAADPWCTYKFTNSAFADLLTMVDIVSDPDWAKQVPVDLPVFLLSGEEDPVGDYGKGVRTVAQRLKQAGVRDVSLKLYAGGRHEMLNEQNREEVYGEILQWLESHLPQA